MVFKHSAPVVKLPEEADESEYLGLLGIMNSSVACFWMKQVFHDKGGGGIGGGLATENWEHFFEFDCTKTKQLPIPSTRPLRLGKRLDRLAKNLDDLSPLAFLSRWIPRGKKPSETLKDSLELYKAEWSTVREQMISLQEELDWECYRLYGLVDKNLVYHSEPPSSRLGWRSFEMLMGSAIDKGILQTTWFERHNSSPLLEPHPQWPPDYQDLVRQRLEEISSNPNVALIEQPEYKRRWNTEPWDEQLARALSSWLLDRLESYADFDGRMNEEGKPTAKLPIGLVSVGRLADLARQDETFHEVGALYRDDEAFDVTRLVSELVESESVPLLPVLRYKPSGLRKRAEWETTWDLQRREDAIDARSKLPKEHPQYLPELDAADLKKKQVGNIPVPPKYTSADFLKGDYWRLRGKLDVPKERWVSFPHCEGEDGTLMIAWAGYDHLQLARSISAYYVDVQERLGGRDDPRLVPLLACLVELLPWLKQWHNEVDPEFGVPMGDYFDGFLQEESRNLNLTLEDIRAWQPPQKARGGGRTRGRASG